MPANAAAIERHYTQPPDDARGETCWECDEGMVLHGAVGVPCLRCNGSGTIDPQDAAEALGERWADDAWEAQVDREMGL